MAKELKMYIPVTFFKSVTRPDKFNKPQKTHERHTTLLCVSNCKVIRGILPSDVDIAGHVIAQKQAMDKGGKFTTIKISVTPALFADCCREISGRIGGRYAAPGIDIIFGVGQLPIIQIMGNKAPVVQAPQVKKFKMVRTIQ